MFGIIPYEERNRQICSIYNSKTISSFVIYFYNEYKTHTVQKTIVSIDYSLIEMLMNLVKEKIITIFILKYIMITLFGDNDCIKELLMILVDEEFLNIGKQKYICNK